MDIHTLQQAIAEVKSKWHMACDRADLHPSDMRCDGKVLGLNEALITLERMLHEELDYREKTQ